MKSTWCDQGFREDIELSKRNINCSRAIYMKNQKEPAFKTNPINLLQHIFQLVSLLTQLPQLCRTRQDYKVQLGPGAQWLRAWLGGRMPVSPLLLPSSVTLGGQPSSLCPRSPPSRGRIISTRFNEKRRRRTQNTVWNLERAQHASLWVFAHRSWITQLESLLEVLNQSLLA